MARKLVCCECGFRNYKRAWDCASCGRTTKYAKVRAASFITMLAVAAGTHLCIQSVIRSALPG